MKNDKMLIRIYGKSPACLETYRLFSIEISNVLKKLKSTPIALEIDRKLFDLSGSHREPVIEIDGNIVSEGKVPSSEEVSLLVNQVSAIAA